MVGFEPTNTGLQNRALTGLGSHPGQEKKAIEANACKDY